MLGATEVSSRPLVSDAAAANKTGRGPTRSAQRPVNNPNTNERLMVIEKTSAVAPLPTANFSLVALKKAPKL